MGKPRDIDSLNAWLCVWAHLAVFAVAGLCWLALKVL